MNFKLLNCYIVELLNKKTIKQYNNKTIKVEMKSKT